jgi:hypothetical protein
MAQPVPPAQVALPVILLHHCRRTCYTWLAQTLHSTDHPRHHALCSKCNGFEVRTKALARLSRALSVQGVLATIVTLCSHSAAAGILPGAPDTGIIRMESAPLPSRRTGTGAYS